MLANAVLMFTSTSILHHPSFMKKESGNGGGGEVVEQHRGAINLAVNVQKYALTSLLPYFAATHLQMQEDKSPGYDEEEANEIQRAKEKKSWE